MDYLTIEGLKPWDGRYEFDLAEDELTVREWGWVKRLTGYLPMTIMDGLQGADPELFTVLAAVALRRAGKIDQDDVASTYERMLDQPAGRITIEADSDPVDEEVADAGPPESSSGSGPSSGIGSTTSSASSDDATPPATGTDDSATSELRLIGSGS